MKFGIRKLELWGYQVVVTQYRRVTDGQTDTLRSLLPELA